MCVPRARERDFPESFISLSAPHFAGTLRSHPRRVRLEDEHPCHKESTARSAYLGASLHLTQVADGGVRVWRERPLDEEHQVKQCFWAERSLYTVICRVKTARELVYRTLSIKLDGCQRLWDFVRSEQLEKRQELGSRPQGSLAAGRKKGEDLQ